MIQCKQWYGKELDICNDNKTVHDVYFQKSLRKISEYYRV